MSKSDENSVANTDADKAQVAKNEDVNDQTAGDLATISSTINLNKLNVIGIFGTESDLAALLRSSMGRVVKVKVGDRAFGGRIVGIDKNSVRLLKSNINMTLKLHDS